MCKEKIDEFDSLLSGLENKREINQEEESDRFNYIAVLHSWRLFEESEEDVILNVK